MANKRVKRPIEMMINSNPIPMKFFYNDVYFFYRYYRDIIDLKLIYTNILSIDILYKLTKKKKYVYIIILENLKTFLSIILQNLSSSGFKRVYNLTRNMVDAPPC